jgi:hypothetical protein
MMVQKSWQQKEMGEWRSHQQQKEMGERLSHPPPQECKGCVRKDRLEESTQLESLAASPIWLVASDSGQRRAHKPCHA